MTQPTYPEIIFGDIRAIGIRKIPHPTLPYFSISDFPLPRKETTWSHFPTHLHFQPEKLLPFVSESVSESEPALSRTDSPTYPEWDQILSKHTNPKTVLARKTTLTFPTALDPLAIIHSLRAKSKNSLVFGVILAPHLAFVGATPELLFKRRHNRLYTEALAGTRTLNREQELLASQKDREEFLYVKNEIAEKLVPIAKPFSVSSDIFVKKTSHLCHLHYPFEVELKENISDASLISLLHPTPAIGGKPKNLALEFIKTHEPFDRGWYAGTLGMMTPTESDIYVGIRSAIIEENKMHIFAGAGIVNNSLSNSEWQELEDKIKLWM